MKITLFAMGCLLTVNIVFAQKLPSIFGDHMVIQRSQPAPVWGWATPGEKLTINLSRQHKEATADKNGKWKISLDPEPAGGPYELTIQGKNLIRFLDVMIGEVWLCSGQSNMEFELKSATKGEEEVQAANEPQIRQIRIPHAVSAAPLEDFQPVPWIVCSPGTAGNFTAVGYFFAKELSRRLHVAVGLINSSWGGTMIETWISRGAFEKSPEFKTMINSLPEREFIKAGKEKQQKSDQQIANLKKLTPDTIPESEWKNNSYNSESWPAISVSSLWESQPLGLSYLDGIVWYRKELVLDSSFTDKAVTLSLGTIDDNDQTFVNGVLVGSTKGYNSFRNYAVPAGVFVAGKNIIAVRVEDNGGGGGFYGDSSQIELKSPNGKVSLGNHWHFRVASVLGNNPGFGPNDFPTLLYNAMINPVIAYGIRGALWYQGEANADRAYEYRSSFPLMINDWRQRWAQGNFPFYFVQLASYNAANGNSRSGSSWAELREAQTLTLSLPNTGMAVTTDIGEASDIHPKNKLDVGKRLAAIALNKIYSQPGEYSGPVYDAVSIKADKMILSFTHTGTGLMVKDKYGYVRGFEIAGSDHQFHYARAFIQHNELVVYSDEVTDPVAVHYGWSDDAGDANLYNAEGFPAVPFRTDQWKGMTDAKKYVIGK